ncbi:MAG: PAS domain S-box protein [Anaerolineae bacterium]|nr:PAS domain S-box protein [Anaerolineae bacterium]
MIARFDRQHRYLYVNPVIEDMTNLPASAFLRKTNREMNVPEGLSALWEAHLNEAFAAGEGVQFEFSAGAGSEQRDYDARIAPELDADGNARSVLAVVRDITERVRTERALQRYASRLRFLQELDDAMREALSPDAVAEAVLPYTQWLLACERSSVALYDLEAGEAKLLAVYTSGQTALGKGKRLPLEWDWFVEELAQGRLAYVDDVSALPSSTGISEVLEAEGVHSLVGVPLIVHGELIGSLNLGMARPGALTAEREEFARQMADRMAVSVHQAHLHAEIQRYASQLEQSVARRAEALEASNARFRTMFEDAAVGIALLDAQGTLLTSNPALQQMLGYGASELQGMNVAHFTHPDDVETRDRLFEELLTGKRRQYRMETRYIRKDGSTLWVYPTVSVVRTQRDGPRYAIKMVEDVTEQRQAREALIQAERLTMAARLGASLAHEINNPLQTVIGSLGLVEELMERDSELLPYVQIALEELERAGRIVAQLRDLNRRSQPEDKAPTQINETLEKVLLLGKKQAEVQRVMVHWDPGSDLPEVVVVPDRMRQVFLNLLLNAVEAMPGGGELHVSTSRTDDPPGIRVQFTDSGMGIPEDMQAKIFEPFSSTRPEGLGLGLYISKTIVEEHGGRLEVESKEGEGSTFSVWLPA